ncbi:MAG: S8 family serine peptidase [Candidatus Melainabacteria bacterium]|nr:S8 family serine peptidase [Candidatus Melainabacteria bacterium]
MAQESQSAKPVRELKMPTRVPDAPARQPRAPRVVSNVLLIMPTEEAKSTKPKTGSSVTKDAQKSAPNNAGDQPGDQPGDKAAGSVTRSGVTHYGAGATALNKAKAIKSNKEPTESPDDDEEGESEDLMTTLRTMGGQVVDTIGQGALTVWVVKFDTQDRFLKAEKQLTNDTRVKSLQRDYLYKTNIVDSSLLAVTPDDPYYASQWYFDALNVLPAWKLSKGGPNVIGVIDSGTNAQIDDLKNKCSSGFDAINRTDGQDDVHGHGTMVATTAAATANNGTGTAGPATLSNIYPVRVGYSNGEVSVSAIVRGIERCGQIGVKIINISSNGNPPYTFANRRFNRVLHEYLQWYHDEKDGLVFNSAGNSGTRDRTSRKPYLICVSAIDENYSLADFSTIGGPVWFTAPGTNIFCTDKSGHIVSVNGTSFSSPLCASVAALIWGAKPSLTNLQVERIMIDTSRKSKKRDWNAYFGFGMPDAEAAMKKALGTSKLFPLTRWPVK